LHGNRPTKDWDILRGLDEDYYPSQDKAQVFIMLDKCDSSAIRQVKDLAKKYAEEAYTPFSGELSNSTSKKKSLFDSFRNMVKIF
jgi:hypothetical protein